MRWQHCLTLCFVVLVMAYPCYRRHRFHNPFVANIANVSQLHLIRRGCCCYTCAYVAVFQTSWAGSIHIVIEVISGRTQFHVDLNGACMILSRRVFSACLCGQTHLREPPPITPPLVILINFKRLCSRLRKTPFQPHPNLSFLFSPRDAFLSKMQIGWL